MPTAKITDLGPLPNEAPREIVLGGNGPVGSDSMSSLPHAGVPAAEAAATASAKKRGRPAGPAKPNGGPKSRKIAGPTAAAAIESTIEMRAHIRVGESVFIFNSTSTVQSATEFSSTVQKWHDEVRKAWGEELMKPR